MHFFEDYEISGDKHIISGENARHISKSLRMKKGEELSLCTPNGTVHNCIIEDICDHNVVLKIISSQKSDAEPSVKVTLYQALTKGDKMEMIIQKSVELGVSEITPVLTQRCISRPDGKSLSKKKVRWQKIAKQAAMQSGRGIIPKVNDCISFGRAVKEANGKKILFYECGGESLKNLLGDNDDEISIFIGSEGGFASDEVDMLINENGNTATLGKRILRAETAPLCAMSLIMYQTGNME